MKSTNISINETGTVTGALGRTVDEVSTSAHRLIDSAAARPTVDRISAGAHQAVDRLAEAAAMAADSLDTRGRQLRAAQSRLIDNCYSTLREKPVSSLGVAVAAGFLLGWYLKRR